MSLAHYLFSFSGRINRAKQWAVLLVSLVHNILLIIAFANTIGFGTVKALFKGETTFAAVMASPEAHLFAIIFCVLFAIGFYIGLAVAIKRLHDRNRSAWWVLVFFLLPFALQVPVFMHIPAQLEYMHQAMQAIQHHLPRPHQPNMPPLLILLRGAATLVSLWAFVELYCLRGTVGDNRFGPDPLAR